MASSLRLPSDAPTEKARARKILAEWRILTQLPLSPDGISYRIPHKEGPSEQDGVSIETRAKRCEILVQPSFTNLSPTRRAMFGGHRGKNPMMNSRTTIDANTAREAAPKEGAARAASDADAAASSGTESNPLWLMAGAMAVFFALAAGLLAAG